MDTADTLYPALLYPPGNLEAGHTYYWRVRVTQAATGQRILSGWSEPKSFTVRPGFATRADYASVHAFTPSNGCAACPVKPVSFSWSGYQGTSKYRFLLARDSQLQDVVVDGITSATSYAYQKLWNMIPAITGRLRRLHRSPATRAPFLLFTLSQLQNR